ncbi:helix-turn-helix domain-containing protein [Mangrovicoccus algicola]|uniref:Helix-turn-helix domain-containing protein n=1 Tax=Mangrovicoccus algicola TaxID=2771008 RepID=A0A8J6YPJ6_9RHOB|nr:helix-turn-helix domain-containing protein [Mangrovicoccus algicola]MBE3637053.1 helix-turn-helix domain-containing protein [Mangrovicoccus algicola]
MTRREPAPADGTYLETPKGFDDYELVLGDILRGERATMGKSLLDVQRDIKVKAGYIAAIEEGDLSAFETPGFIGGYVRSYGRYLGLDPELVYQAFCEQTGYSHVEGLDARVYATARSAQPNGRPRPRPVVHKGGDAVLARNPLYRAPRAAVFAEIRPGAVASTAALLVLLGGLGYGAWSVLQSIQRVTLAPVETPVVALDIGPAAAGTESTDPGAVSRATGEALMNLYRPQALDAPVMVARDGPIATLDPRGQGAYAGISGAAHPARQLAAAGIAPPGGPGALDAVQGLPGSQLAEVQGPPAAAAPAAADVAVLAPQAPGIVLFANDPVWVRVSAADGTKLLEKTLAAGERYVLPQTETAPSLRAGNSGALFFAVNGATLGPAGPAGSVTKNVELSAAALSDRYQAVDMTAADPELRRLAELVMRPETPQPE